MALNEKFAHLVSKRGLILRSREVLEPGVTLFKLGHRFVDGARKDDWDMAWSPWWVTEGSVAQISVHQDLSDAFRRAGAIARRWGGSGDHIVKVATRFSLIAYIGPGAIQDFRHDKDHVDDLPLWVPTPSIAQVFVPLRDKDGHFVPPSIAFSDAYVVPIDKWDSAYIHASPPARWRIG